MNENDRPDALALFLDGFWKRFVEAEANGDFSVVAPLCADDLLFQSPGEEPYETLSSLAEAWWTPPSGYSIGFDHAELVTGTSLAVQRGVASDHFVNADGDDVRHRYNYLAVFGLKPDGWKLTHFSSNAIS